MDGKTHQCPDLKLFDLGELEALGGCLALLALSAFAGAKGKGYTPGCKKLAGQDTLHRVRVGDWRISYAAEEGRLIVLGIEVDPQGAAYRFEK